jgi:hypothetical protein
MRLFSLVIAMIIATLFGCKTHKERNGSPNTNSINNKMSASDSMDPSETKISPWLDPAPIPGVIVPPFFGPGLVGNGGGRSGHKNRDPGYIHFVPNSHDFWSDARNATTHLLEGCTGTDCECNPGEPNCQALPAYANILLETSNFVWCKGGPYALCYYSGPSDGSTDLSCTLSSDGRFANCKCFEIPWGTYFVDINAILNYSVYQDTIQACGSDGSGCTGSANINKAPVCDAINRNNLIPGADLISAFSLDCVPTDGIGQTDCTPAVYAGCMTAPCQSTDTKGIVECSCPTFDGPFQVGTTLVNPTEECVLGNDLVWSAAYSPSVPTLPPLSPCVPDAPGSNGCPLYNNTMVVPPDTDCQAVCEGYACLNGAGVEPAFTCDATLCTGECNERLLLEDACQALPDCSPLGLAAIIKLESDVECSCCASQLCGCTPNDRTNNAIFNLNRRQRDLSIIPQCDVNGTLCGVENPVL